MSLQHSKHRKYIIHSLRSFTYERLPSLTEKEKKTVRRLKRSLENSDRKWNGYFVYVREHGNLL